MTNSITCVEQIKPREIDVWINGEFIGTYGSMTAFNEPREKPRRDTDIGIQLELVGNLAVEFFDNVGDEGIPEVG